MRIKTLYSFLLIAVLLMLPACSDNETTSSVVSLKLTISSEVDDNLKINGGTYTFTNVSTGLETKVDYSQQSTVLMDGLYNVTFIGTATYEYEASESEEPSARGLVIDVAVQGAQQNVTVKGGECTLNMELNVRKLNDKGNFVIAEIFATGTLNKETNKQYNGDQYIRIFNNSSETLYADGLIILESKFTTVSKEDYKPDIMGKAMTVQVVAMIPGKGTEFPILPGKSLIICDNAIDHREANPESADLSKANFEWFTNSTSASNPDVDNPDVPNLNMLYNYTATVWVLAKQGNRAYAIGRLPENVTPEEYLTNYTYTYSYTMVTGKPSKDYTAYYFPNEWIIDAVNMSPANTYVWNLTDPSLDMGYTSIGVNATIAENYGKAVVRKVEKTVDGRDILKDTNNSAADFNSSVRATLLPAK